MNNGQVRHIEEDEIDLRELWKIIVNRKIVIFIVTTLVTLGAIVYVYMKNPIPVYSGNVMLEIGEVKSNTTNLTYLDNPNNLKHILEKQYSLLVTLPKRSNGLMSLSTTNVNKEVIKRDLEKYVVYVLERHKSKAKLFEKYIMTKQIGNITIGNEAINKPKKKLIVVVSFITGLVLSIFLVFLLDFIAKARDEDESTK
ncbi:hypothetical protein HUE87_04000 [Candidatus Sulfurimonas marisnigri]|uniref:Polysaccharide chain length determinant N-terminal domain-containing protein n=1 Tax=Candidatus Sulfurimonas marisnigri TaxID=2740405 RepID=A0A7S7RR89_9BACT|nr:Wzz/FepE/Etk N-terminal domain-containing protein [Candidatus Sulfurimonas marisnigri]QOY55408.1 hypothetical protein HUE87_04000 [Candidatus Sulfurimonas marisnigri]